MKTLAVITEEKSVFKPFKLYSIDSELQLLLCRCPFKRVLIGRLKKLQVCGYIGNDEKLPFKRFDGNGIFCLKLPMLIKKLIKLKKLSTRSVAVVSGGNDSMINLIFANIADIFREFYIISTDYDYAVDRAEQFLCDYGIAVHTEEPDEMCDVEVFAGNDFCGLGRCLLNYNTGYEINHGYALPVQIDSRAFVEALLECEIITAEQIKGFAVSLRGSFYD